MMKLENKTTTIEIPVQGTNELKALTYADLISMLMNTPKQGGYSIEDIENRTDIKKELKKADESNEEIISFENANGTYLKNIVKASDFRFPFVHEDLKEFFDVIKELKAEK